MRIRLLPNDPEIGRGPYFWLVYLGYFIAPYFFVPPNRYQVFIAALVVAVFFAVYFRGYWLHGAALWRNALMMTALGVVAAQVNPGAAVFFIYSACFGGGFERVRHGIALIVINVIVGLATAFFCGLGINFWLPTTIFPIFVGGYVVYASEIGRGRRLLLRKQEEIEHLAKIAERERIARDLHDVLGHTLSVITLKSELARKLVGRDPAGAEREMHEVETTARETLTQVREAISGYRSTGWAFELEQARKVLESGAVTLHVDAEPVSLPAPVENVLSLALREAVTNIVRHAAASRCVITLWEVQGKVCCDIGDNGIGVLPVQFGNGLKGMRERVQSMGGELAVTSSRPGIKLAVSLPLS